MIIKISKGTLEADISYLGIGCLFETKSGINTDNLDQVLKADIKMAALISSVWQNDDPLKVINEMHEKIICRAD